MCKSSTDVGFVVTSIYQDLYRPWKVLEFYSEFQAWKVLGKGIGPGKPWKFPESPRILKQRFGIFYFCFE